MGLSKKGSTTPKAQMPQSSFRNNFATLRSNSKQNAVNQSSQQFNTNKANVFDARWESTVSSPENARTIEVSNRTVTEENLIRNRPLMTIDERIARNPSVENISKKKLNRLKKLQS